MAEETRVMYNMVFLIALLSVVHLYFGLVGITGKDKKDKIFRTITILVGVFLLSGSIYAKINLFPVNHKAKITGVVVNYEDIQSIDATKVDSIKLLFGNDSYTIPNSLYDVDSFIIKDSKSVENFKNYDIVLDDTLNYPLIKRENKDNFKSYLEDKFIERTYKDIK